MGTRALRSNFHLSDIFVPGQVTSTYILDERMMILGAMPLAEALLLDNYHAYTKADFFLQRRELGIINLGGPGFVEVDGNVYPLSYRDSLYIGVGRERIVFRSVDPANPSLLYMNAAPGRHPFPTRHLKAESLQPIHMGTPEKANVRKIYQCIIPGKVESNQLVMGFTELEPGSNWNTMPAHTHLRRQEFYFYFNLDPASIVIHLMGKPDETRHIIMKNHEGVYSPSWSIHSGTGTSAYSFVWSMIGENQDYTDMDMVEPVSML